MTTRETIAAELKAIAAEAPEGFGYQQQRDEDGEGVGCFYEPDDFNPYGCVIGYLGRRLGFVGEYNEGTDARNQEDLLDHLGLFAEDDDTIVLLQLIQGYQDDGRAWKEAIDLGLRGDIAPLWGAPASS